MHQPFETTGLLFNSNIKATSHKVSPLTIVNDEIIMMIDAGNGVIHLNKEQCMKFFGLVDPNN